MHIFLLQFLFSSHLSLLIRQASHLSKGCCIDEKSGFNLYFCWCVLQNPLTTKQVLNESGWFNTGDTGWIAPHHSTGRSRRCGGVIVLEGRAKDTIVLSTGIIQVINMLKCTTEPKIN